MEPSGCNQWQPVANRLPAKTARLPRSNDVPGVNETRLTFTRPSGSGLFNSRSLAGSNVMRSGSAISPRPVTLRRATFCRAMSAFEQT